MSRRIYLSAPHMGGGEQLLVDGVFADNFIAPVGPALKTFEEEFCAYTGIPHAVALSSGTAAMHLVLHHLGVGPGDLVLASTLTFIGSVSPATFVGAEPVFIDADLKSWNMDPALLKQAISDAHAEGRKVGAVIPTDLYGQCADYDAIRAVCDPHGIPVIADAAEAMGARYGERHAGAGVYAGVYSFNGNKIITSGGGGMLASDDAELIEHARKLSQQARDDQPWYEHSEIGYNYRMSNVLAAIGLGQLRVLDERVARKREIFARYRKALGGLDGVSFMPEAETGTGNRWLTVIQLDPEQASLSPDDIRLALEDENIESRPVWKPMHRQPVFAHCRTCGGAVSEQLFARGLCLPSGTGISDADYERITGLLRGLLEGAS